MRRIGELALEHEIKVGDMISTAEHATVYTVLDEKPERADISHTRVFVIHSSRRGEVFDIILPAGRSKDYPLELDGVYLALGDEM